MNEVFLDFHGLTVRPYGSSKGVRSLPSIRVMLPPDAVWSLKQAASEAHCSYGELCRAILMQWVSDHPHVCVEQANTPLI